MTEKPDTVLEDIAFMRSLAEAGRRRTIGGSKVLILSGLMFGGAALFHWAFRIGLIHVGWLAVDITWISVSVIFAILVVMFRRQGSVLDETVKASRDAMSIAVYVLLFVFGFALWKLNSGVVMELFMASTFALYGANWMVAAKASRRPALNWVAVVSFASAIIIALLLNNPNVYLFFAIALMSVSVVPGLMLSRKPRAES